VHAIGASEGGTVFEIEKVLPEDQEPNPESEVLPAEPGEPEEVVECPCHETSMFIKGKPQSIISLLSILPKLELNMYIPIVALGVGVGMKPLLHIYLILVQIYYNETDQFTRDQLRKTPAEAAALT